MFDPSETDCVPLISKPLLGQRVTCLDTNTPHLLAGYATGEILLWDLAAAELAKTVSGMHFSAVICARFLPGPRLWMASSDADGKVYVTEFSRTLFGVTGTSSLIVRDHVIISIVPMPAQESNKEETTCLVGLGDTSGVIVVSLEPTARVLCELATRRRGTVRKGIPYFDWGRGALPGEPENARVVLAVALGKVVQLVKVQDCCLGAEGFIYNGYYESEHEVQSLYWLSEGVLVTMDACRQLTILYTGKFTPGKYREKTPEEALAAILSHRDSSAELEPAYHLPDEPYMQVHSVGRPSQMRNSYHQTFASKTQGEFLGLTKSCLLRGRLKTWEESLSQQISPAENWIYALRLGLEMYAGKLKGFAELSEYRSLREPQVRAFLKGFVRDGLCQHLRRGDADSKENLVLVNVAVELCVAVAIHDYLFSDLTTVFVECGLEELFLSALEPYILTGKFRTIPVARSLVCKQINHYAMRGKFVLLERLLLFLDLHGQDLDYLSKACSGNNMFSALICVATSQDRPEVFVEAADRMHAELVRRAAERKPLDLRSLIGCNRFNFDAEQSCDYLGYKLLWYLQICFEGKRFPRAETQVISADTHTKVSHALLSWFLLKGQPLLQLDARTAFQALAPIFRLPDSPEYFCDLLSQLEVAAENTGSQYQFGMFLAYASVQPGTRVAAERCVKTALAIMGRPEPADDAESLVRNMLAHCGPLKPEQVSALTQAAETAQAYSEVLVYLAETNKDYGKCFDIYVSISDRRKSAMIFPWLVRIRSELTADQRSALQMRISENAEKIVRPDVCAIAS